MMNRSTLLKVIGLVCVIVTIGIAVAFIWPENLQNSPRFDGERAYKHIERQVSFGPRIPGTQAHAQTVEYIRSELEDAGWQVELQEGTAMGHDITNIVGRRGNGSPLILIGAHYDTRIFADNDPDFTKRSMPVQGANDGASGVAVLLELARALPRKIDGQIWLVFFDAEDNGRLNGWDWILGSQAFASNMEVRPDAVIIVDMVGDADLHLFIERNSDQELTASIWAKAAELGYERVFLPIQMNAILDDHVPFLRMGIPAVDLIDIYYPYWHTTGDTLDKVSAESLQAVGDTLLNWLLDEGLH